MNLGTFSNLSGNYKEIGLQEVKEFSNIPEAESIIFSDAMYDVAKINETMKQIKTYYPELLEELIEVAKEFHRPVEQLRFVQDSYLFGGGCSLGALKPESNVDGKMYLFRTYDMDPMITEMRLCSTSPRNFYNHTGFSSHYFGRSDGMNEHGLCVMFASCGMPVGNYPGMQKPQVSGFNFMVVVRLFLEKCRTIKEVIDLFLQIPIASNVNLLVADGNNEIAILETLNGIKEYSIIDDNHAFLTNHAVLEEIKKQEKYSLNQSEVRENKMKEFFCNPTLNSKESINQMIQMEYPDGITSLNYKESFGTVYSVIFNVTDKTLNYSFGSSKHNPMFQIKVGEVAEHMAVPVNLPNKSYGKEFWRVN